MLGVLGIPHACLGIPLFSLANTDDSRNGLDFVIPCNNQHKKSIDFIFWLLAKEYFKVYGS